MVTHDFYVRRPAFRSSKTDPPSAIDAKAVADARWLGALCSPQGLHATEIGCGNLRVPRQHIIQLCRFQELSGE